MDVKAESQNNEELRKKFEESQRKEEVMDVALKAADAENRRLALKNDILVESKEDLQQKYGQLLEGRNFWAVEGAGLVMRTCLRSPEVYDWLLSFASAMMNIGYSNGVKAVFAAHLKDKDPREFKDFAKGDVDTGEQLKRRVERFRCGQMLFDFLEYLAANTRLFFEELREMETAAYRRLDGSYGGMVEPSEAAAGAALEKPTLPESPPATDTRVEGEGSEPSQQPEGGEAAEAEILMKEVEMLTVGSWDPKNTQGFGIPK